MDINELKLKIIGHVIAIDDEALLRGLNTAAEHCDQMYAESKRITYEHHN